MECATEGEGVKKQLSKLMAGTILYVGRESIALLWILIEVLRCSLTSIYSLYSKGLLCLEKGWVESCYLKAIDFVEKFWNNNFISQ